MSVRTAILWKRGAFLPTVLEASARHKVVEVQLSNLLKALFADFCANY